MLTISISPVDVEQTQEEMRDVAVILENSQKVVIQNQGQYEQASELLRKVKDRYREIEEWRKTATKPIDAAKKAIMDLVREPLEMLEQAEKTIKQCMISYTEEQEQKAREIQRKLEEEAQKKAEQERKAKEEQERAWRKKQKALEEAGRLDEARKAQEKADQRALEAEAVQVALVPVIAPIIETPEGVSYSVIWKAEVVDISQVPREYMIPNLQALDGVARATKGSIEIPGVRFISQKILSSRR